MAGVGAVLLTDKRGTETKCVIGQLECVAESAEEPEFGSQDLTRVEGYSVLKVTMERNKKEQGNLGQLLQ